jgi:hypothetical protein
VGPVRGCLLLLLLPRLTAAAPLMDSRVGGLSLVGPASRHPASGFYNPAALQLNWGNYVFVDGTLRVTTGSARRRQVDRATGDPLADAFDPAQDILQLFPQLFVGLGSNLGTEHLMVSLSACTPVAQRLDMTSDGMGLADSTTGALRPRSEEDRRRVLQNLFDPQVQGSHRYQVVDLTLYHMYLTLAASYRLFDYLTFGVSLSYVYGFLDLAVARDAALAGGTSFDTSAGEAAALDNCGKGIPCGYENDLAAEAVHARGDSHGIAFSVGLLLQPHPDVDLGAAYVSEVFGVGGDDVPAKGDAWVLRSQAALDNWSASGTIYRDQTGRATVTYVVPDRVNVGITWRATGWLGLNGQFRWLHLSRHDALTIQLTGSEFREQPAMPDRIVHHRGLQDVFETQLGASFGLGSIVELQTAAMLETAGVAQGVVTAATIDALKVDAFVAINLRLGRHFTLRAGYGIVAMPGIDVQSSDFSPSLMVECVDNRYNVGLPACQKSGQGFGLPSAAGEYSMFVHRASVGLSFDSW